MRHNLRFALALAAASMVISACSDQPVSAPTMPEGLRVNAAVLPACDFNKLKADVRNYVAASNDPIYDIIRSMQQNPNNVYNLGMQGLARLATVRSQVTPVLKKAGAGG